MGSIPLPVAGAASRPLARRVILCCAVVALLDGFDTQAIGPAIPQIARDLRLAPTAMGSVFSASQVGFLLGALLFGPLGDRFGRKRILLFTTALFAIGTLFTAFAGTLPVLLVCRVLTGLGLGGASPNFVSLVGEFTPAERRARAVTMLWAAVPFGGMIGSFVAGQILPTHGWHAIFLLGAALPLPALLAIAFVLPESRETRIAPPAPVSSLFTPDMRGTTLLLWLASFMTWSTLVVTALWMPALLQRAGWSGPAAASMLALNNGGGVVGTLVVGMLIGREGAGRALRNTLGAAALLILLLGLALHAAPLFALLAIAAGFAASAAGGAMLAVSAGVHAPGVRATGVGWALGVGRSGTVLGPFAIGILLAQGAPATAAFAIIAGVALIGLFAAILLMRATRAPATLHGA